jgi:hypothetical protein
VFCPYVVPIVSISRYISILQRNIKLLYGAQFSGIQKCNPAIIGTSVRFLPKWLSSTLIRRTGASAGSPSHKRALTSNRTGRRSTVHAKGEGAGAQWLRDCR